MKRFHIHVVVPSLSHAEDHSCLWQEQSNGRKGRGLLHAVDQQADCG